ncbi:hypothetical protein PROFUN_03644 [Planoprotostelium fungivorum]|uniref:Uncharacterized protein n=1 Tax=Planoprotostelium fungivorum TaxID=1890364 RepID=A0A2P6NSH4_9EUKA|nr:hypothetical protein PROFUN_03644 [Planoprotostelium fungivorum]
MPTQNDFTTSISQHTNMTDNKRTHHQQDCSDKYTGPYDTHASHIISADERSHFDLPNSNDGPSNYRNNNAITNQSVHTTIDNHLLDQSSSHSMEGGSLTTNSGIYVPETEVQSRVEHKIDTAKETGDIQNDRYRGFLEKAADAYDIDKRAFNGYSN